MHPSKNHFFFCKAPRVPSTVLSTSPERSQPRRHPGSAKPFPLSQRLLSGGFEERTSRRIAAGPGSRSIPRGRGEAPPAPRTAAAPAPARQRRRRLRDPPSHRRLCRAPCCLPRSSPMSEVATLLNTSP